jgi:hypothetical protein
MRFKVVERGGLTIRIRFHVKYKKKWWHRWRYIRRPPLRSLRHDKTYQYKSVWYTYKGAMAYINQEKKRLNIK